MAQQRLLDPRVLSRLNNMELVARTVVDGFLTGMHRSPFFGFSLEFAEYRPYVQGDDPRFIDWNIFSRTDRTYIKRFLGETNTHLVILLDASASMGYSSGEVSKMEYARLLAASLTYLSVRQHDALGLIVFDEKVRDFRKPLWRPGHLQAVLHTLERTEAAARTNLKLPFERFQEYISHRGLVAVISDFYAEPDAVIKSVRPLAYQGQDIILFHIVDPHEAKPELGDRTLLEDMETGDLMEVSGDYVRREYAQRFEAHTQAMREAAHGAGADYIQLDTSRPLDLALREYLLFRMRRR